MSKKAAIYIRVSTEEQKKGYSIEAQESVIREYAKNKDYEVYDVYNDEGYSGKDFNRPEIQRLFSDLANDKVDVILVWKVDRLSRNNTDVLNLIDLDLTPKDKKLIVTSIDIDSSSPMGHMFISLLSTFARYERLTIIDRVNAGMKKRAEKGLWNGGAILGYDSVNKHLVINKDESKIVKKIFKLRADGMGYKSIVKRLNSSGYKTKKEKDFSISSIKFIVNNYIYTGKMVWSRYQEWNTKRRNGKTDPLIVDGVHEPIISEKLWYKVQEVNKAQNKKYTTNRNFNGNFFLSGLLKCPECGTGMVMSKSKKRSGGYYYYYMCQAFHVKGKSVCNSNLVRKEEIEEKVLNNIALLVNNNTLLDELIKEINSNSIEANKELNDDITKYNKQLRQLIDKRSKLDQDYFDNIIDSSIYNRLVLQLESEYKAVEETLKDSEKQVNRNMDLVSKDQIIYVLKNFNSLFNTVTNEEQKLLIKTLVKQVKVEENRKDIKEIDFWYIPSNVLPSNKMRGALS